MSPPRPVPTDDRERLVRLEVLLESVAERQQDQHLENVSRQKAMEAETREHRHKTANALMANDGRLQDISREIALQSKRVDGLIELSTTATRERSVLDTRLKVIEAIVTNIKVSWKTVAWLSTIVAAIIGGLYKIAAALGWRP